MANSATNKALSESQESPKCEIAKFHGLPFSPFSVMSLPARVIALLLPCFNWPYLLTPLCLPFRFTRDSRTSLASSPFFGRTCVQAPPLFPDAIGQNRWSAFCVVIRGSLSNKSHSLIYDMLTYACFPFAERRLLTYTSISTVGENRFASFRLPRHSSCLIGFSMLNAELLSVKSQVQS